MNATIVTGASRGIGRAVAIKMAEKGPVLLIATPNSEGTLKSLCYSIELLGGKADYVVGDVGGLTTAKTVAEKLEKLGWTPHNLVLNAGVSKGGPASGTPVQIFEDMFKTNFYGVLYFIKEFVPGMVSRGTGNVVIMAGAAAIKSYKGMGPYCASKHAVLGLARALGQEVATKGVRVAPIVPGPVDTDMTGVIVDIFTKKGMTLEAAKTKIAEANDMKELLSPTFIADRVAEICDGVVLCPNGDPIGERWGK